MTPTFSDDPLVTAIIRTHDGDAALAASRAIPSVLAQDLPADQVEIIVISDGTLSEENTDLLVSALAPAPRAALISSEKKYGYYCAPSNFAITEASSYYIAHLDADNEWTPSHLSALLSAIRTPHGPAGWPHFTYSRRHYVRDEGAPDNLPLGDSPLVEWTPRNVDRLTRGPLYNFVDSSDFMVAKSTLFWLAERTGLMWNPNVRRFGDYELIFRMASIGLRGHAVDNISNIYHWTGNNLQLTRKPDSSLIMTPTIGASE